MNDRPGTPAVEETVLPCGRDADTVLADAAADRLDEHERTCPYCTAIIEAERTVERGAIAIKDEDSRIVVPETLLPSIMRAVWSELRPAHTLRLPTTRPTLVTDHVVAAIVRTELDRSPDVVVRSSRVTLEESEVGPAAPQTVQVRVTVSGRYGADLVAVSDDARRRIVDQIRRQLGMAVELVDVEVVDVFAEEDR